MLSTTFIHCYIHDGIHSNGSIILGTLDTGTYIHSIYMAHSYFFFLPLAVAPLHPFVSPFVLPFTYLAPSSCDRNHPPPSQVACKLTPLAPPFFQLTHPSQIPRTPPARAYNDDLGNILALGVQNTNPGFGQSHPAELHQPMDEWGVCSNLT